LFSKSFRLKVDKVSVKLALCLIRITPWRRIVLGWRYSATHSWPHH